MPVGTRIGGGGSGSVAAIETYPNEAAIIAAYPDGSVVEVVIFNEETDTVWKWDADTSTWVNSGITSAALQALLDGRATTTGSNITASTFKTNLSLAKGDVGLADVDNTADTAKPVSTAQASALANKVDKDGTKVLSDNNYTTAEKNKLAGLAYSNAWAFKSDLPVSASHAFNGFGAESFANFNTGLGTMPALPANHKWEYEYHLYQHTENGTPSNYGQISSLYIPLTDMEVITVKHDAASPMHISQALNGAVVDGFICTDPDDKTIIRGTTTSNSKGPGLIFDHVGLGGAVTYKLSDRSFVIARVVKQ